MFLMYIGMIFGSCNGCGENGGPGDPSTNGPYTLLVEQRLDRNCDLFPPNSRYYVRNRNNINYVITYDLCITRPNGGCGINFQSCSSQTKNIHANTTLDLECVYLNMDHSIKNCIENFKYVKFGQ